MLRKSDWNCVNCFITLFSKIWVVVNTSQQLRKEDMLRKGNAQEAINGLKITTETDDTGGSAVVDESSTLGNTNWIANTSSSAKNINLSYYAEHGGESSVTNTNIAVENTSFVYGFRCKYSA